MNQLTCVIIYNYVTELIEKLGADSDILHFRTDIHHMSLDELLKEGVESDSFYFNIYAPNRNDIFINLDIPEYDKNTDYTEYIINLLNLINERIIARCEEFDAKDKFKNMQQYYSHCALGLISANLVEDEKFFSDFAKNVRIYGPEKIRRENSNYETNI